MIKCEVDVERISLVVGKGSIVLVEDRQFEIARKFLKPIVEKPIEKPLEAKKPLLVSEELSEEPKKKTRKKK